MVLHVREQETLLIDSGSDVFKASQFFSPSIGLCLSISFVFLSFSPTPPHPKRVVNQAWHCQDIIKGIVCALVCLISFIISAAQALNRMRVAIRIGKTTQLVGGFCSLRCFV